MILGASTERAASGRREEFPKSVALRKLEEEMMVRLCQLNDPAIGQELVSFAVGACKYLRRAGSSPSALASGTSHRVHRRSGAGTRRPQSGHATHIPCDRYCSGLWTQLTSN